MTTRQFTDVLGPNLAAIGVDITVLSFILVTFLLLFSALIIMAHKRSHGVVLLLPHCNFHKRRVMVVQYQVRKSKSHRSTYISDSQAARGGGMERN